MASLGRWAGSPSAGRSGGSSRSRRARRPRCDTSRPVASPCDGSGRLRDSRLAVGEHVEVVDVPRLACAVASPKPISAASRLLLSNGVHIRHEQSVGHSFLEMPDHGRLRSWDRYGQRLACGRSELDTVSAVGPGHPHDSAREKKITPPRGMVSAPSCELQTCAPTTRSAWGFWPFFGANCASRDWSAVVRVTPTTPKQEAPGKTQRSPGPSGSIGEKVGYPSEPGGYEHIENSLHLPRRYVDR